MRYERMEEFIKVCKVTSAEMQRTLRITCNLRAYCGDRVSLPAGNGNYLETGGRQNLGNAEAQTPGAAGNHDIKHSVVPIYRTRRYRAPQPGAA